MANLNLAIVIEFQLMLRSMEVETIIFMVYSYARYISRRWSTDTFGSEEPLDVGLLDV